MNGSYLSYLPQLNLHRGGSCQGTRPEHTGGEMERSTAFFLQSHALLSVVIDEMRVA